MVIEMENMEVTLSMNQGKFFQWNALKILRYQTSEVVRMHVFYVAEKTLIHYYIAKVDSGFPYLEPVKWPAGRTYRNRLMPSPPLKLQPRKKEQHGGFVKLLFHYRW